jgi:predicted molibdopterin-dependent oxidoreductase YjgC
VPASLIKRLAHDYARADWAQLCWTLGVTEHHNAADNVFALINLALLGGHVGRYGSGLVPLRGQNNVQGGGDMGAIPNKLTGFQDIETDMAQGLSSRRPTVSSCRPSVAGTCRKCSKPWRTAS